jgi:mycothiol synthase
MKTEFTLRPFDSNDVPQVVDVINADALRSIKIPRAVVDGVGNIRMMRFVPDSSEKVVALNSKGDVVGYAYLADKENGILTEVGGAVSPAYHDQGVGGLLLRWAESQAQNLSTNVPAGIKTVAQANLFESETDAIKLFSDSGYARAREWVHMQIELNGPLSINMLPKNLSIRPMDLDNDWDIVGPAMDEAFADHWGVIPPAEIVEAPHEVNEEDETPSDDSFSNAPGHCFIILDGEKVAGGILCNAKLVERADTGRVGSVFVRPRYRKQGLGQTLMKTAFNSFWEKGKRRVILDTDSQSFTHAPRFYTNLGMNPYRHEFLYEKEIRAGREVRRLKLA